MPLRLPGLNLISGTRSVVCDVTAINDVTEQEGIRSLVAHSWPRVDVSRGVLTLSQKEDMFILLRGDIQV